MAEYHWWREWTTDGRMYASRYSSLEARAARAGHAEACQFRWVTDDMERPVVSALFFTDAKATTLIKDGDRRRQPPLTAR